MACSHRESPAAKPEMKAVLYRQPQLLEPQQPDAVGETPLELAPDLVIEPAVHHAQSVKEWVHDLSPIDVASIGSAAAQNAGGMQLHRANPMRSDITMLRKTLPEGPGPQSSR